MNIVPSRLCVPDSPGRTLAAGTAAASPMPSRMTALSIQWRPKARYAQESAQVARPQFNSSHRGLPVILDWLPNGTVRKSYTENKYVSNSGNPAFQRPVNDFRSASKSEMLAKPPRVVSQCSTG